jgi:hypothetical protein
MAQVVFSVESDSPCGDRWCIKRDGSMRATYRSKTQAIVDARQLAAFQSELYGRTALVVVLGAQGDLVENFVCEGFYRHHQSVRRPVKMARSAVTEGNGNAETLREFISRTAMADSGLN